MRTHHAAGLLACLLLPACSDSSSPAGGPQRTPAAYATGVVRDDHGAPLPYAEIQWRATPAPDSSDGAIDSYGVRGFLRTDSLGRYAIQLGYFSGDHLDTLRLVLGDGGCSPFAMDTILELGRSLTGPTDTALTSNVQLTRAYGTPHWTPGPRCATLIDPSPVGSSATFQFWIDSIGPSGTTWGRFRINYAVSVGDDIGTFTGTRTGDSLIGTMTHAQPWGTCTSYRLAVGIAADSTLGTGHYTSTNCPTYDWPLTFVELQELTWPGP